MIPVFLSFAKDFSLADPIINAQDIPAAPPPIINVSNIV
jgi:hypothetical protein